MGLLRPATPGFITTLVATILLAVVSFSTPIFKSIYFLKASLTVDNITGSITFGTLGYCIELASGVTCSTPSVGYELNINQLVGNKLPIQIPQALIKWLTYALVLHIVALGLAGISAIFGLLAHVREMSMTCFSTCISGFAATVAFIAFIFDVAFFLIAKTRINAVQGGSASLGNALWLTLAAWILLFFSGCFYTLGRCCIKRRSRGPGWNDKVDPRLQPPVGGPGAYPDQMQLDAIKAEADRKARQKQGEGGLPAFQEYQPLNASQSDDEVYVDEGDRIIPYKASQRSGDSSPGAAHNARPSAGGYVPGQPGTRAVDEYYSPSSEPPRPSYPPRRQASANTFSSGYAPSNAVLPAPPPPLPNSNNYLAPADPYASQGYGHNQGGTSYYSAPSHEQYPTAQSGYDGYDSPSPGPTPVLNPDLYNSTSAMYPPPRQQPTDYASDPRAYYSQSPPIAPPPRQQPTEYAPDPRSYYTQSPPPPERHYPDNGYGANVLPPLREQTSSSDRGYFSYGSDRQASAPPVPAPINTAMYAAPGPTSPIRGPRSQNTTPPTQQYGDSPPGYDAPGGWDVRR